MSETKGEQLVEIAQSAKWMDIDEMLRLCDEKEDFWEPDFATKALEMAKKEYIRRQMKGMKDASGLPLFVSIVTSDAEGNDHRVYKPERLFNIDDYRQVVKFHANRSRHHLLTAHAYQARADERYHVQIPLPFDVVEGA